MCKREIISAICGAMLAIGLSCAAYDTTFSGLITANATWSGTVRVTGDVTVQSPATLTIAAGTTVDFDPKSDDQLGGTDTSRCELIIDGGTLDASGTAASPITLTSRDVGVAKAAADWYGIRVINNGNITLQWCTIEYGVNGLQLTLLGATQTFQDSTIRQCSGSAVDYSVAVTFTRCVFDSNYGGLYKSAGSLTLDTCAVLNSGQHAVFADYFSSGSLNCTNCTFRNSGSDLVVAFTDCSIANCTLAGSSGRGLLTYYYNNLSMSKSCVMENVGTGMNWYASGKAVAITDCIVRNNAQSASDAGLWIRDVPTTFTFSRNQIKGNRRGFYLERGSGVLTLSAGNDIYGNTDYEIYDDAAAAINATGTYFGDPTYSELNGGTLNLSKIYDIKEDGTKGQVAIASPYVAAPQNVFISTSPFLGRVGINQPFSAVTLATETGTAPFTWTLDGGALPAGMSVSSGGVVSGTPTAAGYYGFTVKATDNGGLYGFKRFDLTVSTTPPPTVSSISPTSGPTGGGANISISGNNFANPATVSFGGVAATNVNVTSGNSITCTTPSGSAGTVDVTVRNPDGGSGTLTGGFTYTDGPVITSPTTATGAVGVAFSYKIEATGSPTSFGASGLPAGLGVSYMTGDMTGDITGTPTAGGQFNVTLSATNANGTGRQMLALDISGGAGAPVIASSLTAAGTAGKAFSYGCSATGSTPITFNVTELPPGLSFNNGVISGAPAAEGQTSVTLTATNSEGSDTKTLVILVGAASGAPAVLNPTTISGKVGTYLSHRIVAVGTSTSSNKLTFSISPALPADLTLTSRTISGVPQVEGEYAGQITATNTFGSATAVLTISIAPPPPSNASITAKLADTYREKLKSSGSGEDGSVDVVPTSALAVSATLSLEAVDLGTITETTAFSIVAGDYYFVQTLGNARASGKRGKLDLAKGMAVFAEETDVGDERSQVVQYGSVSLKWSAKKKQLSVKASRKVSDKVAYMGGVSPSNIVCGSFLGETTAINAPAFVLVEFGGAHAWVWPNMVGKAAVKTARKGGGENMVEYDLSGASAKGSGSAAKP